MKTFLDDLLRMTSFVLMLFSYFLILRFLMYRLAILRPVVLVHILLTVLN